jgi:hypothetical protein
MTKCGVDGCKGAVVDGLKQLADASHSGDFITIDSKFRFYWCEDHEYKVRVLAVGKLTKPLTRKELRTELK